MTGTRINLRLSCITIQCLHRFRLMKENVWLFCDKWNVYLQFRHKFPDLYTLTYYAAKFLFMPTNRTAGLHLLHARISWTHKNSSNERWTESKCVSIVIVSESLREIVNKKPNLPRSASSFIASRLRSSWTNVLESNIMSAKGANCSVSASATTFVCDDTIGNHRRIARLKVKQGCKRAKSSGDMSRCWFKKIGNNPCLNTTKTKRWQHQTKPTPLCKKIPSYFQWANWKKSKNLEPV